jgi:hypothetical protein
MKGEEDNITKHLCLVQIHKKVDFDKRVRCFVLKRHIHRVNSYKVIEIVSIFKVIYIVPHFERNGHFLVNIYKL